MDSLDHHQPESLEDLPLLLDVKTLAGILGMPASGVRALLRRGELPSFKVGRRLFVRREAFLSVIGEQEAGRRPVGRNEVARMLRGLPTRRRR
jgi:hypothetical protein